MCCKSYEQTSHIHSKDQEGKFPQHHYGQAVLWMQRKEVQSPMIDTHTIIQIKIPCQIKYIAVYKFYPRKRVKRCVPIKFRHT